MADQIKKMSPGHTVEVLDGIMSEVEEARGEYDSLSDRLDDIDGGFTPTQEQLDALNSGIDSAKVEQIATNASDISDIETALGGKVDKETGKGLSTNDFTTAEKTKLAGIEAQANKTTVDDALSGSSTNPVQNKVVKSALDSKANTSDIPTPSTAEPLMDGTAAAGTSTDYARADHIHPSDTSKQDALTAAQLAAVNSGIDSTKVEQIETNTNNIAVLSDALDAIVVGCRIDKLDMNPDTRVQYMFDAVGLTPAYMNFSGGSFNYGGFGDLWCVNNNRPVALTFGGEVDYELSHTDFTKRIDGETASDVEDANYAGNFMSEIPLVYVKRWEDERYNYFSFSNKKLNDDYLAQAHTNANGTINPYIYLPMFKGWNDSGNKLRSLMGTYPTGNTTGANEVTYASNCGAGWQIWDKAKIDLVMDLIVLITKSTNCKAKIGNGDCMTYAASDTTNYGKMKSGYETDGTTRSANAQFYGSEGTEVTNHGKHHMIAFYIEDLWGNRWDRCLGFNLVNNVYKVKMTAPYVLDSDSSYETLTVAPPSSTYGWIKNVSSANAYGDVPTEVGASNTSGFANYFYKNESGNRLSLFGGDANHGLKVGRSWLLSYGSSGSTWHVGGSPCYTAL